MRRLWHPNEVPPRCSTKDDRRSRSLQDCGSPSRENRFRTDDDRRKTVGESGRKRLMFVLGLLSLGYVAGTTDPLHVAIAQGAQGRGGGNPNAGREHAPDGRLADDPVP
jgi:hypothetical protein